MLNNTLHSPVATGKRREIRHRQRFRYDRFRKDGDAATYREDQKDETWIDRLPLADRRLPHFLVILRRTGAKLR